MPGYIIHLTEAEMIMQRMRAKGYPQVDQKDWKNCFVYGALLPDACEKKDKASTHFWSENKQDDILVIPKWERFVKEYEEYLDAPEVFGYLVHLHLDWCFFGEYMLQNVDFLDKDMKSKRLLSEIQMVRIKRNGKLVPVGDFFSEEYLYGDYTKMNSYFIRKYNLDGNIQPNIESNLIKQANTARMPQLLDKMNKFIDIGRLEQEGELQVFTTESIEKFLDTASESILQLWENYNNSGHEK